MKVKWLGKTVFLVLTNNKVYNVISIERGWYRIIYDSGDDYLYHPDMFEIVERDDNIVVKEFLRSVVNDKNRIYFRNYERISAEEETFLYAECTDTIEKLLKIFE